MITEEGRSEECTFLYNMQGLKSPLNERKPRHMVTVFPAILNLKLKLSKYTYLGPGRELNNPT